MLKTIPKSNVNRRSFNTYKEWTVTNADYQIATASLSENKSQYKSIKAKYYRNDSNVFTLYGSVNNIANVAGERKDVSEINILSLPQVKYGTKIKPGSVRFVDNTNSVEFQDDGNGVLTTDVPLYVLISLDWETATLVIEDGDGETFTLTIDDLDLETGETVLTYGSSNDGVIFANIDFETQTLETTTDIDIGGLNIDKISYGNIFYSDGLFVFTKPGGVGPDYSLTYKSTKTLHETEVLVSVDAGEFNYSQNPSAVEVTLSGSYDFTTTAVTNGFPAGTKKIKEVLDIKRKDDYTSTYDTTVSGSWEDYYESSSIDPTGSYLAPYITTIGLYDNDLNMVAVAKLPTPIKNLPDYDLNFIIRFDT